MHPSTYGVFIYPWNIHLSTQTFHTHFKLKVLQIQFGIYFSLMNPNVIFSQVLFILVKHLPVAQALKPMCHPGNISPLSCSTNLQIWMMCLLFFFKQTLFISIYSHCHCPNSGHHHFSIELF